MKDFPLNWVEHCKYITWSGKKLIQARPWERNILNINWKFANHVSLNTDRMEKAPKKYKRKNWAYNRVAIRFIKMVRNWHCSSSRQNISFVAWVCVHRQWQRQVAHQHVRGRNLKIQLARGRNQAHAPNNPLLIVRRSFPLFGLWVTAISGKAPSNEAFYQSGGIIWTQRLRSVPSLA